MPIAVLVDDVAGVTVREEFRVETRVVRPGLPPTGPRPDPMRRLRLARLGLGGGLGGHRLRLLVAAREEMCTQTEETRPRIFRSTEKSDKVSVCRKLPSTSR
jgi:hypothetical protein